MELSSVLSNWSPKRLVYKGDKCPAGRGLEGSGLDFCQGGLMGSDVRVWGRKDFFLEALPTVLHPLMEAA